MGKIFAKLKPFFWQVVIIFLLITGQAIADLYLPRLMSDLVNYGIGVSTRVANVPYIWQVGGLMLAVSAGGMLCSVLASYFAARVSMGLGMNLRNFVFQKVESYSLSEFDKFGTASLITRTTNDITQVQMFFLLFFRMVLSSPITIVGGVIMAVGTDASLWWIIAGVVPLLAAAMTAIGVLGFPLFKKRQMLLDKLNLVAREGLTGVRVVRAFDRTPYQTERFYEANKNLTGLDVKVNRLMSLGQPLVMLIMNVTIIAILWFGGRSAVAGDMQLGGLLAFIQYAMQILFAVLMLAFIFIFWPRAAASAARINQVLETKESILDPKSARSPVGMRGTVEFRDVSFAYPGEKKTVSDVPAVTDITFTAHPGETTAIIGGTGSGKTTLLNLILRFYDIQKGAILVDGIDVREMTQEELRKKIAYVPQRAVLFSGSVAENIRYGDPGATDDEVRHFAEVAQAKEFIDGMEGGFDAPIAQGGANVSGGQKQRLSIARALIRRPEIYLFDDSFSALDFKTDARLRSAMKGETKDATVMIVAQRVSTVMEADRIVVLDEGQVVGIGTHRELIKSCEVYREIVSSQLSEEELA